MKRKSPNAVQKWVDSITISGQHEDGGEQEIQQQVTSDSSSNSMAVPSTSSSIPSTSCNIDQESRISTINKLDELISEEDEVGDIKCRLTAVDGSIADDNDNSDFSYAVSSLSNKDAVADENEQHDKNLCDNLNNSNNNNNNSDNSNDNLRYKLKNLNNLGKIKLNEFYENNKKKYGKILQSTKSKQSNNKNNSDNSLVVAVNSPVPPSSSSSNGNNLNNICTEEAQSNINNNPDALVAAGDNNTNIDNKLLLNDNNTDNDKFMINTSADLLLIKNKNKHFNKRKVNLSKIGRSFSETRHDDTAILNVSDLKFYDHRNSDSDFLMTLNDCDNIGIGDVVGGDCDVKSQGAHNEFNTKLLSMLPSSDSNINQTSNSTANNSLLLQLMHNTSKSVDNDAVRKHFTFSEKSIKNHLIRDNSTQSDSSHCSSVESLLESRKPDPEAILINLGFGPVETEDVLSKIPKRFLKPSQLKGIDTEAFVRQQKMASQVYENSVLGYRGLVGNPHISPSSIVAKIYERFQQNETNRLNSDENRPLSAPPTLDNMDI